MRPFDLEAFKAGEPVQDSNGREYFFVAVVPEARPSYQLVVRCGELVRVRHLDGSIFGAGRHSGGDLRMAGPKKVTLNVAFRQDGTPLWIVDRCPPPPGATVVTLTGEMP